MTIESLIAQYGLLALFVGAAIEGETVVVTGGLLAHQQLVPFGGAMLATAAGSFLADQTFFLIGRRYRQHPRILKITARPAFARALAALERYPMGFVFAFRFLYGLRTVSPIVIGMSAIATRTFVMLNAAAALVWGALFTGIGYLFGHGVEELFGMFRLSEHGFIIALVAALALFALVRLGLWVRGRDKDASL